MIKLKITVVFATVLAMGLGSTVPAQSATSYTLKLTIIDEDAATNVALYDDAGDQSTKHGVKKCSDSKLMWLNPDQVSTSDILKYQKIGNKSKI
jgi:hypothetical protein